MTDRWLSVWQHSGLRLDLAVLAASASSTAIIGFVEEELNLAHVQLPDEAMLSSFPNARLAFHAKRDGAREFELVVRSLMDGLHASLAQDATSADGAVADPVVHPAIRVSTRDRSPAGKAKPRIRQASKGSGRR
jgi:hypothetical protein